MSPKSNADEIINIVNQGWYESPDGKIDVSVEFRDSIAGTHLYRPEDFAILQTELPLPSQSSLRIEVWDSTTQVAARKLTSDQDGKLALLNFASARNPGGGFLNGAKAQEEDLCRCSNLYSTLLTQPTYYEVNRRQKSLLYTDYLIYSPRVCFFKTRGSGEFLSEPFFADVITAPAPNTRPYLKSKNYGKAEKKKLAIRDCFLRRWKNVFAVAAQRDVEFLLLGAWGCGAFGGDPEVSAQTALLAVEQVRLPAIKKIVFAIPNRGKVSQRNFETFDRIFSASREK